MLHSPCIYHVTLWRDGIKGKWATDHYFLSFIFIIDCENDEGEATEEELDRIEGEKYDVERKCSNKIVRGVSKPDVQLPLQQRGLKMEKEYKLVSESMKSTSYFPSHGVQCNSGIHDRMDHTTSDTDDNNDVTSVPADEADLHQGNDFGDNDPSTNDVLETNDGYDTDDNKESVTFDKTLSVRSDEIVLDAVYIGYVDYIGDSYLQSAPPLTSKLYYESMDSEDSDSDDENNEKRFKKFYKF